MSLSTLQTNYPRRFIGKSVDHDAIKVRAFHDQDIVILDLNDHTLSWSDREFLRAMANKKFGAKPQPSRPRR